MQATLIQSRVNLPVGGTRTEGVHLSRVLRNIAIENKVLRGDYAEELKLVEVHSDSEEWWQSLTLDVQCKVAMGLAWEDYYGPLVEGCDYHPGELEVEGIYMTPDGESIDVIKVARKDKMVTAGHEFKLTYKSTKTVGNLATQWLWLMQMKCYARAMGTTVFYLHTLFVCGDYSYPMRPMLKVWRLTFTQAELDEAWDIVTSYVQHHRAMEAEAAFSDTQET